MKTGKRNSYMYLRFAHKTAICFGLPYTRRKMKDNYGDEKDAEFIAGQYRYSFDKRLIPVWTFYACLNAYVVYYNYVEGVRYVGKSFKTCFEESYCFALIELLNRNIGPSSNVLCSMFYGRRSKNAGLAGTERALRFLDETRELAVASNGRLSRLVMVFSPVSLCLYLVFSHFYMSMVPPVIVIVYWTNGMGQMVVYMLVFIQYYVLERSFARINDLVETFADRNYCVNRVSFTDDVSEVRQPSLIQLTDMYDELCTLVDHVNGAYVPEMLLQWVYNIIRVIMVVFRLLEIVSSLDGPLASATSYLIVEHVGELFMFVLHTTCMCTVGERLSREVISKKCQPWIVLSQVGDKLITKSPIAGIVCSVCTIIPQSKRILSSLEKLRLHKRFNTNMELKKATCIFYVRANARNVYASIGGLIIFNMTLVKCVCSVLVTYILVLIQFRDQKGNSKPLYHNWNEN